MGTPNPHLFDFFSVHGDIVPTTSLTLRDLFAAFALAGVMACDDEALTEESAPFAANQAYLVADAMLIERAKAKP